MVPLLIQQLDPVQGAWARKLDQELARRWRLGRNLSLIWCWIEHGVRVLMMPFERANGMDPAHSDSPLPDSLGATACGKAGFRSLLSGNRHTERERFDELSKLLGLRPFDVPLPGMTESSAPDPAVVDAVVRLYGITRMENRAVALVDIVGFSLCNAVQQATQLNSLIYSINAAQSLMMEAGLPVQFVRSTTGDGFYLWNQDGTSQGNIYLYFLLHLMLADNALARRRYAQGVAPRIRAAFHVGEAYEFNQIEALHPTLFSFIVGDLTIELARILEGGKPDQILIGNFRVPGPAAAGAAQVPSLDTAGFVEALHGGLKALHGLRLGGAPIECIKCYLTGRRLPQRGFEATRLQVVDKHGISHDTYNAKLNIHRVTADPIFLGLQHKEVMPLRERHERAALAAPG